MTRLAGVPALLACMLALVAGCGGDDDEETVAEGGVTADDVASCIDAGGLEATVSDSTLIGLETQHQVVNVALEDLEQGAAIAVFENDEDAEVEAEAADVAMGVGETEVVGNTIWGIDASVEDSAEAEEVIPACLS